nr:MAG TPA: hypothetical protein [Caudoviricetes sp.]
MTCKNCLYYEACKGTYDILDTTCSGEFDYEEFARNCKNFTDRSEWVHLPCEVGDLYSLKAILKTWIKNKYVIVRYDCQKNKPYKIVSYDIRGKELLKNEDILLYDYLPSMNFSVIANGFNTREEAEKALGEKK